MATLQEAARIVHIDHGTRTRRHQYNRHSAAATGLATAAAAARFVARAASCWRAAAPAARPLLAARLLARWPLPLRVARRPLWLWRGRRCWGWWWRRWHWQTLRLPLAGIHQVCCQAGCIPGHSAQCITRNVTVKAARGLHELQAAGGSTRLLRHLLLRCRLRLHGSVCSKRAGGERRAISTMGCTA